MSYFAIIKDNVAVDIFQGNVDDYLEEESRLQDGESIQETTEKHYNHLKIQLDKEDAVNNPTQQSTNSLSDFDKKYSLLSMMLNSKQSIEIDSLDEMWKWMNRK